MPEPEPAPSGPEVRAWAPGRVNLIGEHTDYMQGLAVPMAIDRGTTITGRRVPDEVELDSEGFAGTVRLPLDVSDPAHVEPHWGRYVAGVISVLRPPWGIRGQITTTIPVGAGLSSSAALELAVARAVGAPGSPRQLALACQEAEQLASGVPCGVMDQLASAEGVAGHVLLIDFATLDVEAVALPEGVDVVVVPSGEHRELATSAYAERRRQLEAAQQEIGPLRQATAADVERITDETNRRRARHVVSENERVRAFVASVRAGDLVGAGALMVAAHASFRDDFEASTPGVDALVEQLVATPGVYGARLTGGGFGGCAVALTEPGTLDVGWTVRASGGARVEVLDG